MIGRNLPALALALFSAGVALGFAGIRDEGDSLTRAGILIGLAALPPFVVWQSQRAHQNTADQLADAHTAGYRLALEHVAAGLLDQHTAPPDGGDHVEAAEHDRADLATEDRAADDPASNVRRLFIERAPKSTDHTNQHQEDDHPDTGDQKRTGT